MFLEGTQIARLIAAVMVAILAVPASADATAKTVRMGLAPSAQKRFKALKSNVNAYFPASVSVRVGDSVRFVSDAVHTVELPGRGAEPLPVVVPTGEKANATDAAGARFWFRGFDLLRTNPKLRANAFGKILRYDGRKRLNSGFPPSGPPRAFTVRFAKAGRFTYFCNIHPGMKGAVRVLPRSRRVPSAAADRRAVKTQVEAALRTAKRLTRRPVVRNVVRVGRSGVGGVERFAFAPAALEVTRGTTVKFAVTKGSRLSHTATTGPGNPATQPFSYLGRLAESFALPQADPRAAYPSDPPTVGAVAITPRLHGNGFWNSGIMDGFASSPVADESSVRFTTAGRYEFYCLVHPFMRTTVTVR